MTKKEEDILVQKFNTRDSIAFSDIYTTLHRELYTYASLLYNKSNVIAEDVIQDIFMNVWSADVSFNSISNIKSYLYTSIKNSFRNHLSHKNYVDSYNDYLTSHDAGADINIVEMELYSLVDEALKILPGSYAEVLRLYLDGYKSGEIAKILNRREENVYNIKHKAISLLIKKLPPDKIFIITHLLGI